MSDESRIVYSKLSRKFTREGTTIDILIYRAGDDAEWILEVVDEEGASIVWEESFRTEQDALNEAFQTIANGGLDGFHREPIQRLH